MKGILGFIRTTAVGGILFLIPLVLIVVVVGKGFELIGKLIAPIAHHLPHDTVFGSAFPNVVASLVLLLICLAAGLVARTRFGDRLADRVESLILRKAPGYTFLKNITQGTLGVGKGSDVKVAMANLDDAWVIAFIMEEAQDGTLTVFVPSAPTPTAGSLYFLKEEQVKRLDLPMKDAVQCLMQLGVGSNKLLAGPRRQ